MSFLQYALLGDLHGHYKKTKAVLEHMKMIAPEAIILGLGDLFECHISKKKADQLQQLIAVEEATTIKKKFKKLLTFPSIIGNQEERIAQVTGCKKFLQYKECFFIEQATIMHGHQFEWDDDFEPTFPYCETPLLFFGHSHRAAIYVNERRLAVPYEQALYVGGGRYEINVGAVVESRDWCLYDSEAMTVTFYQAPKWSSEKSF